ncbi:hypothetical protein [Lactobacillus phage Sabazios]|nr:hypothetical protein [Lactobacillus phage Sabazios]
MIEICIKMTKDGEIEYGLADCSEPITEKEAGVLFSQLTAHQLIKILNGNTALAKLLLNELFDRYVKESDNEN